MLKFRHVLDTWFGTVEITPNRIWVGSLISNRNKNKNSNDNNMVDKPKQGTI